MWYDLIVSNYGYTVIRESFLNRQMALYVFNLTWRKGYYGAYRTPGILRPFLFFFIFFSSFTYERKREKGAKYWGYGRHRSRAGVFVCWFSQAGPAELELVLFLRLGCASPSSRCPGYLPFVPSTTALQAIHFFNRLGKKMNRMYHYSIRLWHAWTCQIEN